MNTTPAAELPDTPDSPAVREVTQAVADAFNQGNAHFTAESINVRPVKNGVLAMLHSFP
jgi:hypothetical protein